MKKVFRKEHIGQKVNSAETGNGVIIYCNGSTKYPVRVKSESGDIVQFSTCGRSFTGNVYPTLSFGHNNFGPFDYGSPEVVLEPLVMEDRPVLAYVSDVSLEDAMKNKRRRVALCKKNLGGTYGASYYLAISTNSDLNAVDYMAEYKYAIEIPESDKIIL